MGAAPRTGEIANLRNDLSPFYRDDVELYRSSQIPDDLGQIPEATFQLVGSFQVSFFPEHTQEAIMDPTLVEISEAKIRRPLHTLGEIEAGDQIILISKGDYILPDPLTFRVVGEAEVYQTSLLYKLKRVNL